MFLNFVFGLFVDKTPIIRKRCSYILRFIPASITNRRTGLKIRPNGNVIIQAKKWVYE